MKQTDAAADAAADAADMTAPVEKRKTNLAGDPVGPRPPSPSPTPAPLLPAAPPPSIVCLLFRSEIFRLVLCATHQTTGKFNVDMSDWTDDVVSAWEMPVRVVLSWRALASAMDAHFARVIAACSTARPQPPPLWKLTKEEGEEMDEIRYRNGKKKRRKERKTRKDDDQVDKSRPRLQGRILSSTYLSMATRANIESFDARRCRLTPHRAGPSPPSASTSTHSTYR